jgi:type I restriction enzyme, S subunit
MSEVKQPQSAYLADRALTDLLSFIVDNRGRTCPVTGSGFPLIATNCIKPGRREAVFENVRYVDDETYAHWFRTHPLPGDVIFVCKGSPGRVAVVPDPVPYCIAQDMVALRADTNIIDPAYLYYRLSAPDVQAKIENMHVGTLIPHFKKGDFGQLRFSVHKSLDEQRQIADFLTVFDDSIYINRRIAEDCTALWRAIVRDALVGANESVPLSELADFVNGKNFTKGALGYGQPVIRTPEVRRGPEAGTVRTNIDAADENIAREGDTLFVWSGSLMVARWMWEEGLINQHVFKVLPKRDIPNWLVFALIEYQMPWFLSLAADKATTMGHIKREDLNAAVPIPSPVEIGRLGPLVEPLWSEGLQCGLAIHQLTRARDALLPLLMAGRVRIGDVAA